MADPWWREGVLYQIYPRSFADSNGDGIGDLPGLGCKLDYLEWLGVDGIWLNPIHPSPNVDWGYDVADYLDVHPDLGTLADLDRLVEEARRRGIRVLLDLVPEPHVRPPSVVPRPPGLLRLGRRGAEQLAGDLRRRLGVDASTRSAAATTCTTSPASSPTSTGGTRTCARSSSASCASGSTAASPASGSTSRHGLIKDRELRDDLPATEDDDPHTRAQGFGVSSR